MTGATSHSPFAKYAKEHGFPTIKDLPGSIARKLSEPGGKIAPNSPALEELAKYMKVPLSELQAFAKGPPLEERWVQKIRSQIEKGTLPRGSKVWNKKARAARRTKRVAAEPKSAATPRTPFSKLAYEKGYNLIQLAKEIPTQKETVWKISCGNIAPNHPILARIAEILDVPVGQLAAMQHADMMSDGWRLRAEKEFPVAHNGHKSHDRKPGKAVVLATTEHAPGGNGNGAAPRGTYNRLGSKRADLQLRQSARAMIATLNVAVMQGATHMPPLPVGDLYLILQDYVQEKGIRANVLIDPQFAALFDPK